MPSHLQNKPNKFKMSLTEKDWVTYQRFTWAKGKHARLKQIIILVLVFFVLPVFAFYNILDVSGDPTRHVWVGSYYILISFVYLLYKWFIGFPLKYRQTPELYEIRLTYEFFESSFKVIKKSQRFNSETSYLYTELIKVYETKLFFYLCPSKGLALIFKKEELEDPSQLSGHFKAMLNSKFIDCR